MKEQRKNALRAVQLKALLKEARKKQDRAEQQEIKAILRKGRGKWKRVKSPNGRVVRISLERMQSERSRELQPELQHAFVFADRGCKVFLPKEEHTIEGQKSFDAIINGVKFEFKVVKGNARGAEKRCREGLIQSKNVSLYISKDAPSEKNEYIQKLIQVGSETKKDVCAIVAYFQADDSLKAFCFSNR